MAHRGANMSEMLRMQSNMVIEETWTRDPNYRRVYVVKVARGLPTVTDKHELVDVKFNVDTYQKAGADEPAYHLQFRHGAEKLNPDIGVGSYVYMADEDGDWKWWLILGLDERPAFRQYHIAECNWKFGWVSDGKIYYHLGILRNGSSTREIDENSYTSVVNGNAIAWMATNADTQLIDHNQRFLISNYGRKTPLCFGVGNIIDTMPLGITRFVLSQQTFDPAHDNAELMLAGYYEMAIQPTESENPVKPDTPVNPDIEIEPTVGSAEIKYSGTKPTVKVGGSVKTFTPVFSIEGVMVNKWFVSEGETDVSKGTENYAIERNRESLKLKVTANYHLIGKVLTVRVIGTDGSEAKLDVEVIG
ncbi:MAG: hypothetical protein UH850_11155 [Paludibacteraceae bacterium]|nr:hypothetical protein [Paludibacteraceae bacterium]